jgi:hypothetical protein
MKNVCTMKPSADLLTLRAGGSAFPTAVDMKPMQVILFLSVKEPVHTERLRKLFFIRVLAPFGPSEM